MTQEEIKELIRQELKEKLQITIDTERVVFTNDTNIEVSIIYDGNIVSSEYFTIHNYQPLTSIVSSEYFTIHNYQPLTSAE